MSTEGAASATTGGGAVPAVPTDLAIIPGTAPAGNGLDTIGLTWTAPDDRGGSDITGYKVQRWNSDTSDWDVIGTPTAVRIPEEYGPRPYVDRGLTRGKTYYYRVAAVNDEGTGPYTRRTCRELQQWQPLRRTYHRI